MVLIEWEWSSAFYDNDDGYVKEDASSALFPILTMAVIKRRASAKMHCRKFFVYTKNRILECVCRTFSFRIKQESNYFWL